MELHHHILKDVLFEYRFDDLWTIFMPFFKKSISIIISTIFVYMLLRIIIKLFFDNNDTNYILNIANFIRNIFH